MSNDYLPISCSFYDELESVTVKKLLLKSKSILSLTFYLIMS